MKKKILLVAMAAIMALGTKAQVVMPKETPELEFALQLKVTLGEAFGINNMQHGRRTVIPITGGTFEGPHIKGTIMNGGADYQLNAPDGRTELEAIYCIKTDDGVYIHVRNRGIIANGKDADGKPTFYFKAAPQFEAPADSKYGWLNNTLFVCAPDFNQDFKGIVLNVWRVK
ncbi:DUF3237 domain-containing protein [Prevotella sp. MA2016]|uniref:DUF3237 domain-containing protein n=1 Tax=Prevotella sp. MA2016 TaxID=1408310 RepID=UPI000490BF82|nr:DUF3237 domain-containing protein [Prevotella sp. MA2016]